MRIIAGQYKGRALNAVSGISVRPTTDRVKESIFNLIRDKVEGAVVLDLFAGSGALGIEALSRGASNAVFCDHSRDAVNVLKTNLAKTNIESQILNKDYRACISELALRGFVFDIIFLDPPYESGIENEALTLIAEKEILNAGGIIVLERKREDKPYKLPIEFNDSVVRNYGASTISILRRETKAAVTGTFDPFTLGHKYLVERALEKFDMIHVVLLINPDKKPRYSVKKRLNFIEKSLKEYRKKVKISYFDGLVVDYCRQYGIKYLVRGLRNPDESQYEDEMAEYNKTHGDITTLFIKAKDTQISSTLVRNRINAGECVADLVDKSIVKEILAEDKKWKT
ncbi:MAG: 16S rRNA (guanine(966)-N(2))-methyltransferase RsmD [Christensenellaceae bacterium]|jgi:16S rRNA (guanine(966)-N(2))-methyltransferase RsmD/pantetheine-phosphate adenylyltransferase|nr:16S rRNA (guanine(966)-N(2))-methyltransferase RsmD [Christensenellaceae bacterium]